MVFSAKGAVGPRRAGSLPTRHNLASTCPIAIARKPLVRNNALGIWPTHQHGTIKIRECGSYTDPASFAIVVHGTAYLTGTQRNIPMSVPGLTDSLCRP